MISPPTDATDVLAARRAAATVRLDGATLPASDEEVWRYSRVAEVDLDRWAGPGPVAVVPAAVDALLASMGHLAGAVVVHDGSVVASRVDDRLAAAGVFVGRAVDHPQGIEALGSVIADGPDVFTTLNDARGLDPLLVDVPAAWWSTRRS